MNIDNIIAHVGSTVSHKTVSESVDDPIYGTQTESFSSGTDISAIISPIEENDILLKQGILSVGDMKAHVKSDQDVKEGEIIVYDSVNWDVAIVTTTPYMSATLCKTAGLKRRL